MQEQQIDTQALIGRVTQVAKELRKSEAYPAIVGGVAGGIAGAMIAAIIAGRRFAPSEHMPSEETASARSGFNLSLRDAMQLITVLASLAKQVQEWTQKERNK